MRHKQDYIGNIRTFETANFRVSVDAYYDWDTDLSFDETGDVRRKLENGDLVSFRVQAVVTHTPTDTELGRDDLGGCIYEGIKSFQDHRQCGAANRRRSRREGRFQIYRKDRKYPNCLTRADKLRKRGLSTRERMEQWATANVTVPYEIFESGRCGSYFADMVGECISQARKQCTKVNAIRLRAA